MAGAQLIERLRLVAVERLDAATAQRNVEARIQPVGEGGGDRVTSGQHAMGHDGRFDGRVGEQLLEGFDGR